MTEMGLPIRSLMRALHPPARDDGIRSDVLRVLEGRAARLSESLKIDLVPGGAGRLVIVFCGGKCGSSALLELFRSQNMPVIRIHNMDNFVEEHARGLTPRPTFQELILFLRGYYGTIHVVDSYRDPIERRMSSFFQNFRFNLCRMGVGIEEWGAMSMDRRMAVFEGSGIPILERRNGLDSVFPDFFDACFDFDEGIQVMDRGNGIRLMKLRFVDIDEWPRMLSRFIPGLVPSSMPRANATADNKKWAGEYNEWRNSFRLSNPSIFWFLVMDPIFLKYHTMEELVRYHGRWLPA